MQNEEALRMLSCIVLKGKEISDLRLLVQNKFFILLGAFHLLSLTPSCSPWVSCLGCPLDSPYLFLDQWVFLPLSRLSILFQLTSFFQGHPVSCHGVVVVIVCVCLVVCFCLGFFFKFFDCFLPKQPPSLALFIAPLLAGERKVCPVFSSDSSSGPSWCTADWNPMLFHGDGDSPVLVRTLAWGNSVQSEDAVCGVLSC